MKLEQLVARTLVGLILLILAILILFPLGQLFTYASRPGWGYLSTGCCRLMPVRLFG